MKRTTPVHQDTKGKEKQPIPESKEPSIIYPLGTSGSLAQPQPPNLPSSSSNQRLRHLRLLQMQQQRGNQFIVKQMLPVPNLQRDMVAAAVPAAPPFPVPPHLAQVDEPTLHHMQRTLGDELVQRYLEVRRAIELGKRMIHV